MLCSIHRASVFLYLYTPLSHVELCLCPCLSACLSLSLSSPSPSPLETFRSTHPSTSTPPFHLLSTSLFPLGYYSFTWVRLYNVHGAHVCSRDVRAVAPSFTRGLTSRGNSARRNFLALSYISRWRSLVPPSSEITLRVAPSNSTTRNLSPYFIRYTLRRSAEFAFQSNQKYALVIKQWR